MKFRPPLRRERTKPVKKPHVPWLFRLPKVFQINSSLTFLAMLLIIAGLGALFGFSDPTPITSQMSLPWYKLWGFGLTAGGLGLMSGIVRRDRLIEKYSARILEIQLLVFGAWTVVAVGPARASVTLAMLGIVGFFLEQRICFINVILGAQEDIRRELAHREVER